MDGIQAETTEEREIFTARRVLIDLVTRRSIPVERIAREIGVSARSVQRWLDGEAQPKTSAVRRNLAKFVEQMDAAAK